MSLNEGFTNLDLQSALQCCTINPRQTCRSSSSCSYQSFIVL